MGYDVEDVAVLREAVDESDDAGGAREDGAPVLEGEVGRDDSARALVAATDDAVEQVPRASVAGEVSQLVEDEDVGCGVASNAPVDGRHRFLLEEVGEGGVDGGEADGFPVFEGAQSEVLREGALADAAGSTEEDVV